MHEVVEIEAEIIANQTLCNVKFGNFGGSISICQNILLIKCTECISNMAQEFANNHMLSAKFVL